MAMSAYIVENSIPKLYFSSSGISGDIQGISSTRNYHTLPKIYFIWISRNQVNKEHFQWLRKSVYHQKVVVHQSVLSAVLGY